MRCIECDTTLTYMEEEEGICDRCREIIEEKDEKRCGD